MSAYVIWAKCIIRGRETLGLGSQLGQMKRLQIFIINKIVETNSGSYAEDFSEDASTIELLHFVREKVKESIPFKFHVKLEYIDSKVCLNFQKLKSLKEQAHEIDVNTMKTIADIPNAKYISATIEKPDKKKQKAKMV